MVQSVRSGRPASPAAAPCLVTSVICPGIMTALRSWMGDIFFTAQILQANWILYRESGKRMPKIWNKKPIAVLQAEAAEIEIQELMTHGNVPLKRTLSAMTLTALGISNIIGAGIFALTGQAASAHAGPAIALSCLVTSVS